MYFLLNKLCYRPDCPLNTHKQTAKPPPTWNDDAYIRSQGGPLHPFHEAYTKQRKPKRIPSTFIPSQSKSSSTDVFTGTGACAGTFSVTGSLIPTAATPLVSSPTAFSLTCSLPG